MSTKEPVIVRTRFALVELLIVIAAIGILISLLVPTVQAASQPDRIILSWSDDTATTQSVTWRTSMEVNESFAEIVEAGNAPTFPKNKRTLTANRELVGSGNMAYHSFSITFADLKPDTMYCYRIGQGTNWSEWFTFTTGTGDFVFAPKRNRLCVAIFARNAENNCKRTCDERFD